jgi:hypothetical protein
MRAVSTAFVRTSAAPAAALLGCGWLIAAALATGLWAGEARLIEGQSPDRVVVQLSDAAVDEALAVLAARFQFEVERGAPAAQPLRISGRLEGTLEEVLDRILRHQGHMIVRSAKARAGVSRVVLIEAKGGAPAEAPAASLASPIAALKARLQLQERGQTGK